MSKTKLETLHSPSSTCRPFIFSVAASLATFRSCKLQRNHNYKNTIIWLSRAILNRKTDEHCQWFPILPHFYGPLRAIDGTHAPYKPSALLTVRILSIDTKGAGRLTFSHPQQLFTDSTRVLWSAGSVPIVIFRFIWTITVLVYWSTLNIIVYSYSA